ncbi:chemotaxis response regulator protein-glutamate methylesterase [uncultured Paraglaciecola sp.]|uniref:protein-glutamate methylesterase/protein-glutamine glutaminase n=1 Tax=uncultured Paraglaciecola sp. TaxID=1765024 RepID=UPI002598E7C8|nr:chemotaxis response regulator protein-glutamate methylesterase [uncultured Paraglaciecola sp.]
MAYRILIVDDSTFFRRRITQILEQDNELEVVGEAKDGLEALAEVKRLKPDVVTMDVEMPVLDGISAVKNIMAMAPVSIIMFSSLTSEGAKATLDALDAGALDFLPKKFEDIALNRQEAVRLLQSRVKALCLKKSALGKSNNSISIPANNEFLLSRPPPKVVTQTSQNSRKEASQITHNYGCLAIGASTGGPVALQKLLTALPASFKTPIIVVQHMPGTFTKAFAKRLNDLCKIQVKEGEQGDTLLSGVCYIAPGGKQMSVQGRANSARLIVSEAEKFPECVYKPSVDVTFDSICDVYGGNVLAVILTGMGADGKEGCRKLKHRGATIWAQDEKSSVVYGMPQAVTIAKIAQHNYDIEQMAGRIKAEMLK